MKLWTGLAISISTLFGSEKLSRPDPFFQEGNEIVYSNATINRSETARSNSVISVQTVSEKGNAVSSVCMMKYYGENHKLFNTYRLGFACDSVCFYSDARNWLYEPWDEHNEQAQYSGDSLWYPLKMNIGDTLRSAYAKEGINTNGVRGVLTLRFSNRKVVSIDTLELSIGKVAAFKIEMEVSGTSSSMDQYNGSKNTSLEYGVTEWFVPAIGIVKSEHRNSTYGDTRILMESYKK